MKQNALKNSWVISKINRLTGWRLGKAERSPLQGLPTHWLHSSRTCPDWSVIFLPGQWKWFSLHPFVPVVFYYLAHCEHVNCRGRDQPVHFMSNSTFAGAWRQKYTYMCGLTLAVTQREKSHLDPTIFPLLLCFPEPVPPRPCESIETVHAFKRIKCV